MCIVKSGCRLFFGQAVYFDTHFQHVLIILMFISGNVLPNPGPAHGSFGYIASDLTFSISFCECKSLGLLHVNDHSLLHKHDIATSWECTARPNSFAVSESQLKKSTSSKIPIPGYSIVNLVVESQQLECWSSIKKFHLLCTRLHQFELTLWELQLLVIFRIH